MTSYIVIHQRRIEPISKPIEVAVGASGDKSAPRAKKAARGGVGSKPKRGRKVRAASAAT